MALRPQKDFENGHRLSETRDMLELFYITVNNIYIDQASCSPSRPITIELVASDVDEQ